VASAVTMTLEDDGLTRVTRSELEDRAPDWLSTIDDTLSAIGHLKAGLLADVDITTMGRD
jgi:hypothetical protein